RGISFLGEGAAVPDLPGQARGGNLPARRRRTGPAQPSRRRPALVTIRPRRGPSVRAALSSPAAAQEVSRRRLSLRILLTNDAGVYAPGLRALRAELKKIAEVTVVAPAGEQSAVGHSITLLTPLLVQEVLDEDDE